MQFLILLLMMLVIAQAQNKCRSSLSLLLVYKLEQTFVVPSALGVTSVSIELKFHKVDETALLAQFSISGTQYDLYYLPRSSQICLDGDGLGVIQYYVPYSSFVTFQLSSGTVIVSGNTMGFDSSRTECDIASHLQAGTFAYNVAELKIDSTSATTTYVSVLSGFSELQDESCLIKSGTCTTCIEGYFPNAGVCDSLPYGCTAGALGSCSQCLSDFTHDAVHNKCIGGENSFDSQGTGAVATESSYHSPMHIFFTFVTGSWTVQFYVMFVPRSGSQYSFASQGLLEIIASGEMPTITYHYNQAYSPSVSSLKLGIKLQQSGGDVESSTIDIPQGEWVFLTFEQDLVLSSYQLDVEKYGSVSIVGESPVFPNEMRLWLRSNAFSIYMKELLIWQQSIQFNSEITAHKCKFTHGAGFNPLVQFDMNYNPLSADTQLTDVQNIASPTTFTITSPQTVGTLIEALQPVAGLRANSFYSAAAGTTACIRCPPRCSTCSDMYTCTACSSGTLIGGLCILPTLSATSGIADSTLFSFSVSEFKVANAHIMSQLRAAAAPVTFTEAELIYPNARIVTVSDASSFTVPVHEIEGETAFSVTFRIVFSNNGVSYEETVGIISLTQSPYVLKLYQIIQAAKLNPQDSNICECRSGSECNEDTGRCSCESGFGGTYCTFTESELQSFRTRVTDEVNTIESNLLSLTASEALIELQYLSRQHNAVTDATALKIISIVQTLVTSSSTQTELTEATEVLSEAIAFAQYSEAGLTIIEAIKAVTDKIVSIPISTGSSLTIDSPNLLIKVEGIDPKVDNAISPSSDLNLTIPADFVTTNASSVQIVIILFKGSLYQSQAPTGTHQASLTLNVEVYDNLVRIQVNNETINFEMEFAVEPRHSVTKAQIEKIASGTWPESDLSCSFFNTNTKLISTEGCSLLSVSSTSYRCGCNHMTDFMAFLKTALTVIEESNYNAFQALTYMKVSALGRNAGIYFAIGYWVSFGAFCILVRKVDKRKIRLDFFQTLFTQLKKEQNKTQKIQQERESIRRGSHKSQSVMLDVNLSLVQKKDSSSVLEVDKVEGDFFKLASLNSSKIHPLRGSINDLGLKISNQNLKSPKNRSEISSEFSSTRHPKPMRTSMIMRIRERIECALASERKCCPAFGKVFKNELQQNNQVYNLVTHTSLLNTRPVRLSLFYLAVVLQFSLSALFYNLSQSQNEDTPLFWDGIIQNFWVAIYSALFAILPLLLISIILRVPTKWRSKLQNAQDVDILRSIYLNLRRRMRCKAAIGYILFILLSNFLLLYLICFCHIASGRMSEDWARSSSLTLILDLVAFELIPALAVATMAVMRSFCCRCKGQMCFIILIEVYRLYRNLIQQ